MAMPPPKPPNLYNVLGVGENATEEELRRARNKIAKQVHPDKNQTLEELATKQMQKVNEAYRVLSDRVQRRDYDMKLQEDGVAPSGDSIPLPDGRRFSEHLLHEFVIWMSTDTKWVDGIGQSKYLRMLQTSLSEFLSGRFQELNGNCSVEQPPSMKPRPSPSLSEQILYSGLSGPNEHRPVKGQAYRHVSRDDSEQLQTVQKVLLHARTRKNKALPNVLREGDRVPIVDFSHRDMQCGDLATILRLFMENVSTFWTKQEVLRHLSQFIPMVRVVDPLLAPSQPWWRTTKTSACVVCECELLQGVEHHILRLPRRGIWKPEKVCVECCNRSYEEDMQDWVHAGLRFLDQEEPNVRAAMGCFYMAECSRVPGIPHLLAQARATMQRGSPEVALPLLLDAVEKSTDLKEKVRAHLLASSALRDWAGKPSTTWYESWLLLLAAHSATVMARQDAMLTSNAFDDADIQTKLKMIESEIFSLEKQKKQDFGQKVKQVSLALEQAWGTRNWETVLEIVTEETDQNLQIITGGQNYLVEALNSFMKDKVAYRDRMVLEDRVAIHYLQGVLKILQGQVKDGLADIQAAAWNGIIVRWVPSAAAHQVLNLMPQQPESVLPIRALHGACKGLASGAAALNDLDAVFPANKDLDAMSSEMQWPEIELVGRSIKGLYKYEQGVKRQVKEGKWTEHEAALAYLDLIPACSHTAEVVVCFLTASSWFLKELQHKYAKAGKKASKSNLYAIKNAVFWCLDRAMAISHLSLHPGMKVYVSRLCIGTALRVSQLAHAVVVEEDGKKIAQWVDVFAFNCRQCPFWQAPTVMVCEAVLLNIVSGRLHSEFLTGMLRLEPKYRPISLSELHYQLYENDLKTLHPLEGSHAKSRAMMELLEDKGWCFEDVANLMSSQLSPRSDEGWLIAHPEFSVPLEFAAVNGIVLNIGQWSTSIELLVEPADAAKGKPGLLSRDDINHVLQLTPEDGPPFFSLDQPSMNQSFHPFQEFRYSPSQLAGTGFLQTMFEADYLLKSFSIGSDISSKPPFNQRPCSEGLTANLPPGLQAALKPVSERGYRCSHVNRFWIQADEITHDCDQSGAEMKISVKTMVDSRTNRTVSEEYNCELSSMRMEHRFSVPKMSVRAHPLVPGADGKLEDTRSDLDPDSAEAKFARDLTKNYDRLSHYFPVFARLKELTRLWFVSGILRSVARSLEDVTKTAEFNAEALAKVPWSQRRKLEKQMKDSLERQSASFRNHLGTLRAVLKRKDNPCIWVPAALRKIETEETLELSYGGVMLAPDLKAGVVPKCGRNILLLLPANRDRSTARYGFHNRGSRRDGVPATTSTAPATRRSGEPRTPGSRAQASNGNRGSGNTKSTASAAAGGAGSRGKPPSSGGGSGGNRPPSSGGGGRGNEPPSSGGESGDEGGAPGGKSGTTRPKRGQGGERKHNRIHTDPKSATTLADVMSAKKTQVGCNSYEYPRGTLHPMWRDHVLMTQDEGLIQGRLLVDRLAVFNVLNPELDRPQHYATCKACPCMKRTENDFVISTATGEVFRKNVNVTAQGACLCNESNVVYLATCKITGKQYVGQTVQKLRARMSPHRTQEGSSLYQHWKSLPGNKEFHEVFDFEILVRASDRRELNRLEGVFIDRFQTLDNGLNRNQKNYT